MSHDVWVFVLGVGFGIIAICAAELIGMFAAQRSRQRELQSALDRVKREAELTLAARHQPTNQEILTQYAAAQQYHMTDSDKARFNEMMQNRTPFGYK